MAKAQKFEWQEGAVFARHTDKDGNVHYQEHRCWNTSAFIHSVAIAAAKVGGKVEQVDEATFLRWKELNRRHR